MDLWLPVGSVTLSIQSTFYRSVGSVLEVASASERPGGEGIGVGDVEVGKSAVEKWGTVSTSMGAVPSISISV